MKLYTVLENFGPADGDAWLGYLKWRGLTFSRFDSVDGLLRKHLYEPATDEDWKKVYQLEHSVHFMSDPAYAAAKLANLKNGSIAALSFDEHRTDDTAFLGFDLIDGYFQVSLLTNWGNDVECVNRAVGTNGLVTDLARIEAVRAQLLSDYPDDDHVGDCRIASIYRFTSKP